jgi:hypothetical protein
MTTLVDLKRAIASVSEEAICSALAYQNVRAEAWRTAFEWMQWIAARFADEIGCYTPDISTIVKERDEGMRLIREHLK